MYEQIIYQPGPVTRVILNRPEYRNAQSRVLLEELDDVLERAGLDPAARVIVLSGNGPSFSAGHDLGSPPELADRERRGFPTDRVSRYQRSKRLFLDFTLRWRNLPKPTIAMVHGYCIFGGWMIASAMDIIFAAEDAQFLASHFQYFSVPWDLGARKTKEILYESRFISGREAADLGFVNRAYAAADLERETLAYAERVAENDPMTTRMIKFSVNDMLDRQGFSGAVTTAFHTYHVNSPIVDEERRARMTEGRRQLAPVGKALRKLQEQQSRS
jgi:enoyl-CoA hydratase